MNDRTFHFFLGVCVSLSCVKAQGSGTTWREIVRSVGEDEILYFAAHIEPDEWELAGFAQFAQMELGKAKPPKKSPHRIQIPTTTSKESGDE